MIATVNLYGDAADTFQDRHRQLADAFGAWAPGAITNADLSFSTRTQAQQAPVRLGERLSRRRHRHHRSAARHLAGRGAAQLEDAALRAGIPVARLAGVVLGLHRRLRARPLGDVREAEVRPSGR